jgi:dipeptidyl aminopeptidase/acylaminoacyl peptidase
VVASALLFLAQELRYARYEVGTCHPARVRVTEAERDRARAKLSGLEEVTFSARDGVRLRGWLVPPRNGGIVVMQHGLGGNRAQLLPVEEVLAQNGYGVLAYDARDHGDSDGDLMTWGYTERNDVLGAIDYALGREGVDAQKVAVYGFSVGSAAAAIAAVEDPRPRALVLEAVWTSLRDETKDKMRGRGPLSWGPALLALRWVGVDVDAVDPKGRLPALAPRPLLLITGDADRDTPVRVVQEIYDAAGSPKEMLVVPGAGHGECAKVASDEYKARLIAFLDRALSPSEAR